MEIIAEPLTAEAFRPFGQMLLVPANKGRLIYDERLENGRAEARASLSLSLAEPMAGTRLAVTEMERHQYSSQSFVPIEVSRYLIVVAPHAAAGGPDTARVRAFVAGPGQGVTYACNTWHHSLTVLDRPAEFAVFMWRDGTAGDEEFVPVATPFTVIAPGGATL